MIGVLHGALLGLILLLLGLNAWKHGPRVARLVRGSRSVPTTEADAEMLEMNPEAPSGPMIYNPE